MWFGSGGGGGRTLSAPAGTVAALNLNGVADMRSAGAPSSRRSAPQRGHSSASIVRKLSYEPYPHEYPSRPNVDIERALRYIGEPFLYVLELANLNLDGIAGMHSGGSVLEAPPVAEDEHRPRAGHAELYREREPVHRYRSTSPGSRAVPANATGDGA